jgi:hypothetical protein
VGEDLIGLVLSVAVLMLVIEIKPKKLGKGVCSEYEHDKIYRKKCAERLNELPPRAGSSQ